MTLDVVKSTILQLNSEEQAELMHFMIDRLVKPYAANDEVDGLIHSIKTGGPSLEIEKRHDELLRKSVREEMTIEENEEFNQLTPLFDTWAVDRTKMILQLANIWKLSPKEAMEKLNIKPSETVYG